MHLGDNLNEPHGSLDLIWSEGAAYPTGVENALNRWRPLLRPVGLLAFTELTWFSDDPPEPAAAYFAESTSVARIFEAGTPVGVRG